MKHVLFSAERALAIARGVLVPDPVPRDTLADAYSDWPVLTIAGREKRGPRERSRASLRFGSPPKMVVK